MKKPLIFLVFICATAHASQFYKGENLITPYQPNEENWDVLKKNEPKERGMMWLDKKLGFSDSYTVTIYPKRRELLKSVRELLKSVRETQDNPGRKACESFESIDLTALDNKNYGSTFWRTKCETSSGFKAQMINLLIQGEDSLYSVQRVWRGVILETKIKSALQVSKKLKICSQPINLKVYKTPFKLCKRYL
jgi:hypothetical protein